MFLTKELKEELSEELSLMRLAKTGLFQKLPYEQGEGSIETARELELHRAVLDKALIDSFSTKRAIKKEIEEWLDLDNPDFTDACDRAMLNPQQVFMTFKTIKTLLKGNKAKFKKVKFEAED